MRRFASVLIVAALMLQAAPSVHAFTHAITGAVETGPGRVIEMRGNFSTSRGERLISVAAVAFDANGHQVSRASGTFDTSRGRWSADVGDFRMVTYWAEFQVQTAGGVQIYHTKLYRW